MNDLLQAPTIDRLPAAPLLERFLFEQPLLPVAVLVLLAVIAVIAFAGRNQRRRGMMVAGVLVAGAGVIYLVSTLVTTEREELLQRTEVLIGATARVDSSVLADMLTADAAMRTSGGLSRWVPSIEGRAEIIDGASRNLQGSYRVREWEILDRQAAIDGPNVGRSLIRVGVEVDGFSRTHYSWWRLHWERGPDGQWRCFEIEPRWILGAGSA